MPNQLSLTEREKILQMRWSLLWAAKPLGDDSRRRPNINLALVATIRQLAPVGHRPGLKNHRWLARNIVFDIVG